MRFSPTILSGLLAIGAALLPVYAFSSGGLQLSHLILLLFSLIALLRYGPTREPWFAIFVVLIIHIFALDTTYVLLGSPISSMRNTAFFLYNSLLCTALYQYILHSGSYRAVKFGLLSAGAIATYTVWSAGVDLRSIQDTGRSTGSFNNPNQLGYFSVCFLSISYLFYLNKSLRYTTLVVMFGFSIFLSIASLSKAAMIANFLVVFLALKPQMKRRSLFIWVVCAAMGVIFLFYLYSRGSFDNYVFMTRLAGTLSEDDSSLGSRGYFAFLEGNLFQIMFGLGTKNVNDIIGHEVHSTFASILNEYGIIGLALFVTLIFFWAKRLFKAYGLISAVCLAGPVTLYGITHNGNRFTAFWLLFALSLSAAALIEKRRGAFGAIRSDLRVSPAREHPNRIANP